MLFTICRYLSKAHLVEITRRGYFRITPRGQTALGSQPSHIDNKFLSQFEEFRQFRERSGGAGEADIETVIPASDAQKQTPDETMRMAHRQIDSALGLGFYRSYRSAHRHSRQRNACYFFSRLERDGARFISYHYADKPELKGQFDDATEAIRFLTEA
jgi:hypothetical protein